MKILFLTTVPPFPPNDGGRIRTFSLMRHLAEDHLVTLVTFLPPDRNDDSWAPIQEICTEVHTLRAPVVEHASPVKKLRLIGTRRPFGLRTYESVSMTKLVSELTRQQGYDLIHVSEPYMIQYVHNLAGTTKIMDHTDVEALKQRRLLLADASRFQPYWWLRWLEHFRWRSFEISSLAWFDAHCAVSAHDAAYFRKHAAGKPVYVVPNGVDVERYPVRREPSGESTLLYVGSMDYPPNADAVLWFVRQVWPRIQSVVPAVRFIVVGRNPSPQVQSLASQSGITVTGTVPDVSPYYERAHVLVAPLRSGGGTRLKILEAMAMGVPVVSTSLGAEGLDMTNGTDLLIAETPQAFADQVIRLLTDRDLRTRLATRARLAVEFNYDWRLIGERLLDVYRLAIAQKLEQKKHVPA